MHGRKCKGGSFDCLQEEKWRPHFSYDIEGADRRQEWNLIPLLHFVEQSPL
jgi:hypothetical protein